MPFYFDLADRGAAGDPDARKFVVAQREELGGEVVSTPPLFFLNAKGKILGEVSNYATPDEVLQAMLKVLKEHVAYDLPSTDEKNAQSVQERAEIRLDLQDYEGARAILEKQGDAQDHYLLGRIARFQGNWNEMEAQFQQVYGKRLETNIRIECAYRFWFKKEYDKLRDHLRNFPRSSIRYTEARYYEGLSDTKVSRVHIIIQKEDQQYVLRDLNSKNGTWVNGRRDNTAELFKRLAPDGLGLCGQTPPLVIGEAEPLLSELRAEDTVLCHEVFDDRQLLAVDPTSQRDQKGTAKDIESFAISIRQIPDWIGRKRFHENQCNSPL